MKIKSNLGQTALLRKVINIRIHFNSGQPHLLKEILNDKLLGLGAIPLIPKTEYNNLHGNDSRIFLLGPQPVVDGANGGAVTKRDEKGAALIVP